MIAGQYWVTRDVKVMAAFQQHERDITSFHEAAAAYTLKHRSPGGASDDDQRPYVTLGRTGRNILFIQAIRSLRCPGDNWELFDVSQIHSNPGPWWRPKSGTPEHEEMTGIMSPVLDLPGLPASARPYPDEIGRVFVPAPVYADKALWVNWGVALMDLPEPMGPQWSEVPSSAMGRAMITEGLVDADRHRPLRGKTKRLSRTVSVQRA